MAAEPLCSAPAARAESRPTSGHCREVDRTRCAAPCQLPASSQPRVSTACSWLPRRRRASGTRGRPERGSGLSTELAMGPWPARPAARCSERAAVPACDRSSRKLRRRSPGGGMSALHYRGGAGTAACELGVQGPATGRTPCASWSSPVLRSTMQAPFRRAGSIGRSAPADRPGSSSATRASRSHGTPAQTAPKTDPGPQDWAVPRPRRQVRRRVQRNESLALLESGPASRLHLGRGICQHVVD